MAPTASHPISVCRPPTTRSSSHGYRHIPVVEGDRLVGIVSMRDLLRIAAIQPVVHPSTIEAPPGLEGVMVAETEVGDVRGLEGFYHYRQYNAVELAAKRRLEDVWHLLFEGHLPSAAERDAFLDEVRPLRRVPDPVAEVLPAIAAGSQSIMEAVRTAVSLVGAVEGYRPTLDIDHAERRRNALAGVRGDPDADHGRAPPASRATCRSTRATTSATAPTTSG